MRHKESSLQIACVRWFRLQYPNHLIFAIPNGGNRNAITGAILKAEGALAGVPDLFVACANFHHFGLFIEMKSDKGKLSEAQIYIRSKLELKGYRVEVCNSVESFQTVVHNYLNDFKND